MDPAKPAFTANYPSTEPKLSSEAKKYFILLALGVIAMVIWIWLSSPMVISVSGTGEVSVPAETATVSFTLSSNDSNPQSAVSAVSTKADSVRAFLISRGVAEGDIAQSQVTAVPASLVTAGTSGFQATINMALKTTHVSQISSFVSELYANGALVVSQPVLSVNNQRDLEDEALESAIKNANTQASSLALKNWKFIRKIVSINQSTSGNTSTSTTRADTITESNSAIAAQNGVFKIVKGVTITYKLW